MLRNLAALMLIATFLVGCGESTVGDGDFDGLVKADPPTNGFQLRGYDISGSYAPNGNIVLYDFNRKTKIMIVRYTRVDYEAGARLGTFNAIWSPDGKSVTITLPKGADLRDEIREVPGLKINYAVP